MEERFFKKNTIRPESMNTDKFSNDTFGKVLRRYIDDEGIKLIDSAVYVGVNKSTISRYIKGEPHRSNPNSEKGSDFFTFYPGKAVFGVVVRRE